MAIDSTQRVGIYSVGDTLEEVEETLATLRAWCEERCGWKVAEEYFDVGRGRDDFRRLWRAVQRARLDVVAVRSVRELLPETTHGTVRYLAELSRLGVGLASRDEPFLSTLDADRAQALGAVLGFLERQELRRISSRVQKGLRDARRAGYGAGRPRLSKQKRREIVRLRRQGKSVRETAEVLGVAVSTVIKYQHRPVDDLLENLLPRRP